MIGCLSDEQIESAARASEADWGWRVRRHVQRCTACAQRVGAVRAEMPVIEALRELHATRRGVEKLADAVTTGAPGAARANE